MRVALDVTARIVGRTGIARYAEELDNALVAEGVEVSRYAIGRAVEEVPPGTRWIRPPLRAFHRLWRSSPVPRIEWLTGRADVWHPEFLVPPSRRPLVITVYDLDAIERPDLHPDQAVSSQRGLLASLSRAGAIVAISDATGAALVRHGVDESRIVVAKPGLSELPEAPPVVIPGIDRYALFVGTLHHRKGLDLLLRAWATISDTTLVLVGPDHNAATDLRRLAAELGLGERVRWEGAVDDQRLAGLYRGAAVFCLPSRAEGFGLPLLEAMAAGTPIVATDLPVFREVTAGAALLVPEENPAAMADALREVLADTATAAVLRARGTERVGAFTWTLCARQVIAAYERALA